MIQLQGQSCNCSEFIYLNEPNDNATLKFEVNPDGSLTEILSPTGGHWAENLTIQPHGLGSDLNGYLYIANAEFDANGVAQSGVDRYDCQGNLLIEDFIPPASGNGTDGISGYATNMYSVGNILYMNNWVRTGYIDDPSVFAYDICTQEVIGTFTVCNYDPNDYDWQFPSQYYAWDFVIDEENNTIIINNAGLIAVGDLTNDLGGCISPTIETPDNPSRGIVIDNNGDIIVRENDILRKYDAAGNILCETDLTTAPGGSNGWGMVYSETTNLLYLGANDADCITVFDPSDCSYVMQAVPNATGSFTKALAISTECCPTQNDLVIDTLICNSIYPTSIFLQDYTNCDGIICEGGWTPDLSNVGLEFDACNNSVTINTEKACGTFTLSSDGTSSMSRCGAFSITLNIETAVTSTIAVTGNQTFCPGDALTDLVATVSPTATLQWQMSTASCAGPWTDIDGATSATYTPPTDLSATTYYQIIATEIGGCASGSCDEISECITLAISDQCYDVALTKSVDTPTASVGESVTFTIVVENLGSPITGATVNDALPAGLTYNNVYTATTGTYDGTNWTIGNMAAGQIDSIQITAMVNAEGVITNEATVTINETETDLINNKDYACVSIPFQVCDTEVINVSIEAGAGFSNYQWYKDGVLISGATTQTYIATEVGMYTYTVDGAGPTGDCDGELCCPVIIEQISCCPPVQCLPIQVTKLEE